MLVNQNHECEFAQGKSFRVKLWNLWKVLTPRKAIYGTAGIGPLPLGRGVGSGGHITLVRSVPYGECQTAQGKERRIKVKGQRKKVGRRVQVSGFERREKVKG
jgi:hypothetical protein